MHDRRTTSVPQPSGPERAGRSRLGLGPGADLITANGVFAADGLDRGTAVLLRESAVPTGHAADPGPRLRLRADRAGHGAGAARGVIDAVDVNDGRWRCAATTPRRSGVADRVRVLRPDEADPETRYDEIWSNPPIRIGKAALHELLLRPGCRGSRPTGWPGWWWPRTSAPTPSSAGWSSRATPASGPPSGKGFRVLVLPTLTSGTPTERQAGAVQVRSPRSRPP